MKGGSIKGRAFDKLRPNILYNFLHLLAMKIFIMQSFWELSIPFRPQIAKARLRPIFLYRQIVFGLILLSFFHFENILTKIV
jgi:hypothetical protein